MCELVCKTALVTKTPSDGQGRFSFSIMAFDVIDADNEKITNYRNVGSESPTEVSVDYGHLALLGPGADPLGGKIGVASVRRTGPLLNGDAKLDLSNRVAMMVYERLQLPSSDPAFLGEVSVWFAYDRANSSVDGKGIRTIRDAELLSVAVVREGAQATAIDKVKAQFSKACKIGPDGKSLCTPADHFRSLRRIPASDRELALIVETLDVIPQRPHPLAGALRDIREVESKVAADGAARFLAASQGAPQVMPRITRRFAVIQPPAATPTDPDEVIRGIPLVGVAKSDGETWKRVRSSQ